MIRINLIARKVSKKKAGAIQHLAIGAGVLALVLVVAVWQWFSLNSKLAGIRARTAVLQTEKDRLQNVSQEKAKFEKEKSELESKIGIITKLQKERATPVHLLDELTKVIDQGAPVWLDSYTFATTGITMGGFSLSNEAIRPLVEGLEASPFYKDVDLRSSVKQKLGDREVFRFEIAAGVEQPE
jgi:type IV pilus assembly protein PilN